MVLPMLTRKLDWLRVALRASPHNEAIKSMIEDVAQAVSDASKRLDGGTRSGVQLSDPAMASRLETVQSTPKTQEKRGRRQAVSD